MLGVELYGATFCPDGHWLVVSQQGIDLFSDRLAGVPDLCQELNRLLAQNLNCRLDTTGEAYWREGSYECTELLSLDDVTHALVETALLPISRGLVSSEERYPLVRHTVTDAARALVYSKPEPFMHVAAPRPPEQVGVDLALPVADADEASEFRATWKEHYARRRAEVQQGRTTYYGRDRLGEIEPGERLEAPDIDEETICGRSRPRWENHFADSADRKAREAAVKRVAEFRLRYRECRYRLRTQIRERQRVTVIFPTGTWGLARTLHVRVRGSPDHSSSAGD